MTKLLLLLLLLTLTPLTLAGQTAHGATISWTPSTTVGVTGVNVYRCQGIPSTCPASQPTGFTKIGSVPTSTGASYSDSTTNTSNPPTSGSSYVYQVTAQCPSSPSTGGGSCAGESAPSAQVVATIPLSPNPATAITVLTF